MGLFFQPVRPAKTSSCQIDYLVNFGSFCSLKISFLRRTVVHLWSCKLAFDKKSFSPSFDVFQTLLLTLCLCDSEACALLFSVTLFLYGLYDDDANILYLFSAFGTSLGLCLAVSLVSSSRSRVNHITLRLMLSGECYTRSV